MRQSSKQDALYLHAKPTQQIPFTAEPRQLVAICFAFIGCDNEYRSPQGSLRKTSSIEINRNDPIANQQNPAPVLSDKDDFSRQLALAENGDEHSIKVVALSYRYGFGVKQDRKLAFEWGLKGLTRRDARLLYLVGGSYKEGKGTDVNKALGTELLEESAKLGYPPAIAQVALATQKGEFSHPDYSKAEQLFLQTIQTDRLAEDNIEQISIVNSKAVACEQLVNLYSEERISWKNGMIELAIQKSVENELKYAAKAAEFLQELVKLGDDESPATLGAYYESGRGSLPVNREKARALYELAIERGNLDGKFRLAWSLLSPTPESRIHWVLVDKNSEGARLLEECAAEGHAKSQYFLFWLLHENAQHSKNRSENFAWLRKSANSGYQDAINALEYFRAQELQASRNTARSRNAFSEIINQQSIERRIQESSVREKAVNGDY